MTVSWKVVSRILVESDRRFRGAYSLHYQGDESSETSTNFYQNIRRGENLKSDIIILDVYMPMNRRKFLEGIIAYTRNLFQILQCRR
jgi:hypothetical protein